MSASPGPEGAAAANRSLAARAVSSSAWNMAGQIAQVLLSLGSFALLSHWLTPADYGLFGMAATINGFIGIIGDGGVGLAIARKQVISAEDESTGFWLSIGGGALLAFISAAAAPFLARFYRTPRVVWLAIVLGTSFFLSAPSRISLAKLSRHLQFRATTLTNLVGYGGATILAVLVAMKGFGPWALVVQSIASIVLQAVLAIPLAPPRIRPSLFSRVRAREISRFGWQVSGYSMTFYLARSLEGVFAGRYIGSSAIGLLTMGTRLVYYSAERLNASVTAVLVPTMVEIADPDRQTRAFYSATRLLYMLVAPFCLGVVAVAPELVAWLPPKWAALAPVLRAYAVGTLFAPLVHLTYSMLAVHAKSRQLLHVAVALVPVAWIGAVGGSKIGSVLLLVGVWGFCLAAAGLLQLWIVWRTLPLDKGYWGQLALPIAGSVVMALAVRAILTVTQLGGQRPGLIGGAIFGAAVYVGFASLFMRRDIVGVANLLRRRRMS